MYGMLVSHTPTLLSLGHRLDPPCTLIKRAGCLTDLLVSILLRNPSMTPAYLPKHITKNCLAMNRKKIRPAKKHVGHI